MTGPKHLFAAYALAASFMAALFLFASCSGPSQPGESSGSTGADEKISAFVSIPPQRFFVERIGGEYVDVSVLVGENQSPHSFDPSPRQMAELSEADILFFIGIPFEKHIRDKLKSGREKLAVSDASRKIRKISAPREFTEDGHEKRHGKDHDGHEPGDAHHDEDLDPHVWLSPSNAALISEAVFEDLAQLDPSHKDRYTENFEQLEKELRELDTQLSKTLAPHEGEEFFVFHPAFGYFAKEYGLDQVAVETGGKRPGPKSLTRIIQRAKDENVRIIFVQPQFPEKSVSVISKEIGAVVIKIDPLADDYIENLRRVASKLEEAFRGEEEERTGDGP